MNNRSAAPLDELLVALNSERPAWHKEALCAQTDPDAFFPEKGGAARPAKQTCMVCPVQEDCLDYALTNEEQFGIWGGCTRDERRAMAARKAS